LLRTGIHAYTNEPSDFNVRYPHCVCTLRVNMDVICLHTIFIIPNPEQLHVSVAQSSYMIFILPFLIHMALKQPKHADLDLL
jgi:hypothetical protein